MIDKERYSVSVLCMTYNHAKYIKDSMDGFCMQQTSFPYICVVIDDASLDGEQKVISEYLHAHFSLDDEGIVRREETDNYVMVFARHKQNLQCYFAVFFLKNNHYSKHIPKEPYYEEWWANTEYLAFCEGDDYWIDPHKLQKQVDFMEKNPDYGMVCTASKIYVQGEGMMDAVFGHAYRGFEDLLKGNYIFNATVLKRNSEEKLYCEEIGYQPNWMMGDWPRILHCAIVSKIGYIEEPTSVYRVLPESASHFECFEKFKEFNENSASVSKFFIEKYNLDAERLCPQLDSWLQKRLLMKACSVGDVKLVNEYKQNIKGLSMKEKFTIFLASNNLTYLLLSFYRKMRIAFLKVC